MNKFCSVIAIFILSTLLGSVVIVMPQPAEGASFFVDFEFEVMDYDKKVINETHVDFGINITAKNLGKYKELIYKKMFYVKNQSRIYQSDTKGSFTLYSYNSETASTRTFIINFTLPNDFYVTDIVYVHSYAEVEFIFPLVPGDEDKDGDTTWGTWDIIALVAIGVILLVVLGLIYLITSYQKKKKRRYRFLKY